MLAWAVCANFIRKKTNIYIYIYAYVCIYIYIYNFFLSARPLSEGPPGCEEFCYHLPFPSLSNHLNHKLKFRFSFISNPVSAFSCQQVVICSQLTGLLDPMDRHFTTTWAYYLSPGSPQNTFQKSLNLESVSRTFENQKNVFPGSPKDTKM